VVEDGDDGGGFRDRPVVTSALASALRVIRITP
jgi:hypothetical protein